MPDLESDAELFALLEKQLIADDEGDRILIPGKKARCMLQLAQLHQAHGDNFQKMVMLSSAVEIMANRRPSATYRSAIVWCYIKLAGIQLSRGYISHAELSFHTALAYASGRRQVGEMIIWSLRTRVVTPSWWRMLAS